MQNTITLRTVVSTQTVNAGKPTLPLGRQPIVERKYSDPSSSPKSERYPVPSFYEQRMKPKDQELL